MGKSTKTVTNEHINCSSQHETTFKAKKDLLPSLINISLFIGPLVSPYWHMVEWFRVPAKDCNEGVQAFLHLLLLFGKSFCCVHITFSRTFGYLSGNVLLNKLCFSPLTGNTKSRCFKGLCARVLIHGDGLTVIRC